jgi:RING-box protein 1
MASGMDVDDDEIELPTSSSGKGEKKRFEVKKVNIEIFSDLFYL